jgi:hypothetical protein
MPLPLVQLHGFEDIELARLLAAQDATDGLTGEDAVPELPEVPVSRTGDLWLLGDHRVLVSDATCENNVRGLIGDGRRRSNFTDPPYNVSYESYTEDRNHPRRPNVR